MWLIFFIVIFLIVILCISSSVDNYLINTALSLSHSLSLSPPRPTTHDLRSPSAGKRSVGQQIDYKQSELRAITIIDSLCPTMQHYGKVVKEGESRWMRVNYAEGDVVIDGSMTLGGAKSETEGKALKLYCDRVVEEHEDDWVAATQAGVDNLEARVCTQMLKLCGKEAIEALEKKKLHDEKIKKKYSKPALTIDEKRLRKKEKGEFGTGSVLI